MENTENIEDVIKRRKNKIIAWAKEPYNLMFLGALLFIIIIRFYYFGITKNQPIWWDESEYMSQAKAIAGIVQYNAATIRSPIFPAFMSLFFLLDITSEPAMRFIALFIPSILVIILTYFMIKEMYPDKKIALISTVIIGFLWEHLFYSNRFQTENIALIFQFLTLFILFRCYIKNKDLFFIKEKYSLIWILMLSILSVLFRPGNIMFIPAMLLLIVLLNKDKIYTKTGIIIGILFIVAILSAFIFTSIPQAFLSTYTQFSKPFGWNALTIFYGFYESLIPNIPSILFYIFLIGLTLVTFKTFLLWDKIKIFKVNSEDIEFKSNLFNITLIASIMFLFVFIIRINSFEYRWFFPLLPAMLAFTAKGMTISADYIGSWIGGKYLSITLIIIMVILGAYTQFYHADIIIKQKIDSYSQVRDAALWIKSNFNKTTKVLSISYPQTVYYSEQNVSTYSLIKNGTEFTEYINNNRPDILVVSVFEIIPTWVNLWLSEYQNKTIPINAYFADEKKTQPLLIIYRLEYDNLTHF